MTSLIGLILIMILLPLGISSIFYFKSTRLSKSPRIVKTLFLSVVLFLSFEIQIIFLMPEAFWSAFAIGKIMVPVIVVSFPFYYWATAYWDAQETKDMSGMKFFTIQSFGVICGLIVGVFCS